ncbi:MAG: amidohydrolase family protein, partial [Brevundimonas sp.]|nr:amidohydrolase family protein [Brevundimonas sp.]
MNRLAFALCLASTALAAPALAKDRVILADRFLDVASGKYIENPAIFVNEDGRIIQIADARVIKLSGEVERIDLTGKTLVPGFIDMHVHLDSPADIGGYRGLEFTDSFFGMTAVGNARAMLDAGFTTVRNVGSGNRNDVGLKQAITSGYVVGPRIVPGGYA